MCGESGKPTDNHRWSFWLIGGFAFLWVLLRSGVNPKRLTYPCQQVAYPLASSWLLAVIALLGGGAVFWKLAHLGMRTGLVLLLALTVIAAPGDWEINARLPELPGAPATATASWSNDDPVSIVCVLDQVPPTAGSLAAGDSTVPDAYLVDAAIDSLLLLLEYSGTYLHRTVQQPDGLVAANAVVVLKGNFQWTGRNTTSTDRIKGMIHAILQHPDGFSGEILVCDNTQDIGTGINHNDNNSEDRNQSIVDVVTTFQSKGYAVSGMDWASFWAVVVNEYAAGDMTDGYPYDPATHLSYPKFQTPLGQHYVSLRHGVWDPVAEQYDPDRLCVVDMPVVKAHGMAGATLAVKNWIGVLTTAYSDERYGSWEDMHYEWFWGGGMVVPRVLDACWPSLTIVDAAWVSTLGAANTQYVVERSTLLASSDPVAVSWYAAKYILTPVAVHPQNTNPDQHDGTYHEILTGWTAWLQDSDRTVTMDPWEMSVLDRTCFTAPGAPVALNLQLTGPSHIPAGESLVMAFSAVWQDDQPGEVDLWSEAVGPAGQTLGPLRVVPGFAFSPGDTLSTTVTQDIPVIAPSGIYLYRICAGDAADESVVAEATVLFEVAEPLASGERYGG